MAIFELVDTEEDPTELALEASGLDGPDVGVVDIVAEVTCGREIERGERKCASGREAGFLQFSRGAAWRAPLHAILAPIHPGCIDPRLKKMFDTTLVIAINPAALVV